MVRNGRRLFGDDLIGCERRIRDSLVWKDFVGRIRLVVVDGVSEGLLRPVGVHRSVRGYRLVEVVRRASFVSSGEPSLEDIAFARRSVWNFGIEAVLVRLRSDGAATLRLKGYRAVRELEVRVKHQACWHLGAARIGASSCLVGIPALPSRTLNGSGRNVTGEVGRYIVAQRDILRANERAVVVVERQRVFLSIVVEVETGIRVLVAVLAKVRLPRISESLPSTVVLIPPVLSSITSLGVALNLVPVIDITQVVIPHVDGLDAAVRLTIVGRRLDSWPSIVLEPVFEVLVVICIVRVVVHIDSVRWTAVGAHAERRHDSQALELAVVLVVVAPAAAVTVELASPLLRNVGSVLRGNGGGVAVCTGRKRIHITAITDSNDRSTISQNSLGGGVLEREVRGIQFARTRSVCAGSLRGHSNRRPSCGLLGYRSEIRIVIIVRVLDHVNNLVVHLSGSPLGIESGVLLKRDGAASRFGAVSVLVPASEGIAIAGCRRRQGDGGAIRLGLRRNIVTAVDVEGKREVATAVVNLQLLVCITRKLNVFFTVIEICIGIAVDIGSDPRVLDTNLVDPLDQLVAVAVEGLEIVTNLVVGIGGHVLIIDGIGVLTILAFGEIALGNSNGWLRRIVRRLIGNLSSNRKARSGHGVAVGKVALDKLEHLGLDVNPVGAVHIEVVDGELVGVNLFEDCNCVEALGHSRSNRNGLARGFVLPVVEDLALDEGVIGERSDLVAHVKVNEVLRLLGDDVALVVLDDELDRNLTLEIGIQGQIGRDSIACLILPTPTTRLGKPTLKCRTSLSGLGRQNDGGTGGCGQLIVLRVVDHVRNGEDVLVVCSVYG